jgi:hypothetical protein
MDLLEMEMLMFSKVSSNSESPRTQGSRCFTYFGHNRLGRSLP